ncbi:protein jag [Sporolactobacillus shoreicorticis]|uniref:RNA-binding protein KhpB n=1 Tax=Sporolactobacillus shoreicorticis TaxID=1923877 RepID=A0ABW5S888_9BACL|nr:RNA-binding cell elongation regulator Jag/EloR [Sporolactobacillus shoreicorticis]MCO7126098.1 protein jag [Sporolactobacillus shoreicorticis]
MREVTKYGKTVAEAVSSALNELNATLDQADVQILEEPRSGFFGIGARKALVKVALTKTPFDYGMDYLTAVIKKSGLTVHVQVEERSARVCRCTLSGKDAAQLIGKHGKTLNALQFLTDRVVNRDAEHRLKFILDAENYRETRRKALIALAKRVAEKTVLTGLPHRLEPMPAFERKIVHTALAKCSKVRTFSNGEEPRRYLTIAPRS